MTNADFHRNVLGATLKRADELQLGDYALLPNATYTDGAPSCVAVTALDITGDDVTVNGTFTTSIGNTFVIIPERTNR